MPAIHRNGDENTGGGAITSIPQSTIHVNNILVSVNGAIGTSHDPCPDDDEHCAGNWQTANGSSTVFAENIPINFQGNSDTCGHSRAAGSSDVSVE